LQAAGKVVLAGVILSAVKVRGVYFQRHAGMLCRAQHDSEGLGVTGAGGSGKFDLDFWAR
jgi:hypothetical protein